MKNKIEIKYVSGSNPDFLTFTPDHWEMTVWSDIVGKQVIHLDTGQAMVVALAIGIAKDVGKKEGHAKAKKKLKAINEASRLGFPWTDTQETRS